ncbi:hypothetical protein SCAR479_06898 [Seiridium cardinale]|uniref:Uncharacterized protein n=1 Tax=Seiridium cardinale TaxID=138064 RepID=A0ABR2XR30_9PEZI
MSAARPGAADLLHGVSFAQTRSTTWHQDSGDETRGGLQQGEVRHDESLRELIEFLRETPPPPGNLMSVPDSFSSPSSEDGKWAKTINAIRHKQRKSRRKHRPPSIKLPDSAIAATTTGGHRHIAISIPLEHSYLTSAKSSRHYACESVDEDFAEEVASRLVFKSGLSPAHAFGFNGILQPIVGDREAWLSKSPHILPGPVSNLGRSESTQPPQQARDRIRSPISGKPSTSTGTGVIAKQPVAETKSVEESITLHRPQPTVVFPDKASTLTRPTRPKRRIESATDHAIQPGINRDVCLPTRSHGTSGPTCPSIALASPERQASRQAGTMRDIPLPIASLLSPSTPQELLGGNHSGSANNNDQDIRPHLTDKSVSGSVASTESEPVILEAKTATAHDNATIVIRPPSQQNLLSAGTLAGHHFASQPSDTVSRPARTDVTSLSPFAKLLNRKEKVRQRKQKDIEGMKKGKPRQTVPPVAIHHSTPGAADHGSRIPIVRGSSDKESTSTSSVSPSIPRRPRLAPTRVSDENQHEQLRDSLANYLGSPKHGSQGSPASSTASPSLDSLRYPEDRISYHRRLEKRADRDAHNIHNARHAAEKLVREGATQERISRRDSLRRYERLKESRFRDIEKRLCCLERNSDVWLRSMAPLMERLNRLLEEQHRSGLQPAYPTTPSTPKQPRFQTNRHESLERGVPPGQYAETGRYHHGEHSVQLHSMQGNHMPRSALHQNHTLASGFASTPAQSPQIAIPGPTQEEFEEEMIPQQRKKQGDAAPNLRTLGGWQQQRMIGGGLHNNTKAEVSSQYHGTTGMETLEPLMRELQGAAEFGTVSIERSGSDESDPR